MKIPLSDKSFLIPGGFIALITTMLIFILYEQTSVLRDLTRRDCYTYVKPQITPKSNQNEFTFLNTGYQLFRYSCISYNEINNGETQSKFGMDIPADKVVFVTSEVQNSNQTKITPSLGAKLVPLKPSDIKVPAVYLEIDGGIGNQLFQYACSYTVAKKNNWPLYVYVPSVAFQGQDRRQFRPYYREFALDRFEIPLYNMTVNPQLFRYSRNISTALRTLWDADMLLGNYSRSNILQMRDYCHSEQFFLPYKNELIAQFSPKIEKEPIKDWLNKIAKAEESVGIHVRKGDQKVPINFTFFEISISRISNILKGRKVSYFVFSDGIALTKQNFNSTRILKHLKTSKQTVHFVSDNKLTSIQEFYLLSRCKHQIISPSTFSWWAAYLNPNRNKTIIAARFPTEALFNNRKWRNNGFYKYYYTYTYYPVEWIILDA